VVLPLPAGDPSVLAHDGVSADYGIGFYGHWKEVRWLQPLSGLELYS
jgi:hypothetical protein